MTTVHLAANACSAALAESVVQIKWTSREQQIAFKHHYMRRVACHTAAFMEP